MTQIKIIARIIQITARGIIALVSVGLLLVSSLGNQAGAAGGVLDVTFGSGGKVTTDFSNGTDLARGVALQPDGKIIVVGSSNLDVALARYKTDGRLDSSFGSGGRVTTDFFGSFDQGASVALQIDGKIVVAGSAVSSGTFQDFALARYNSDGSPDLTFGSAGKLTTDFFLDNDQANAVALGSDGKIIAAGRSFTDHGAAFALARYNTNGSLDSAFGSGGKVITGSAGMSIVSLGIQSDNKIIAAGTPGFSLVRYDVGGAIDSSFGSGGIVTTNINGAVSAIALQVNGKIVAAGSVSTSDSNVDFALLRYNSNGSLDTSFGTNGLFTLDFRDFDVARAVAIQSDGKIVAVGQATQGSIDYDFAIARLESNGSLDPTFGQGGKLTTDFSGDLDIAWAVTIQPDGKIVAVGDSYFSAITGWDFGLARYDGGSPAFDTCIQDDSNGNILELNSSTGDYLFTNCAGFTFRSVGSLITKGSVITLQDYSGDRRVLAKLDRSVNRGTGSIQDFSRGMTFTIIDRNTANDSCACMARSGQR